MAYCGPVEVNGDEVIHHIENSLFPEWIDTDLVRRFAFHDGGQTLRLVGEAGGLVQHLVWERVG